MNDSNEGIYTAVIVDTRITDLFELVLDNFYNRLDKRWNFMIFCSNNNKDFLFNLLETKFPIDKKRTSLIVLDIDRHINVDISCTWFIDYDYNKLLTIEAFYNMIPTEMFLIFQLDTLLSDKYTDNIYNFMEYDYVGAPWPDKRNGGNGGLSLRKKSKMLSIVNDKNYSLNNPQSFYHEDGYFCGYPNLNVPDFEKAKSFAIETVYYDKPIGIHKPFNYINNHEYNELLTHFPRLYELNMKWNNLFQNTHNYQVNQDKSYKTNFFDNYKIINFS